MKRRITISLPSNGEYLLRTLLTEARSPYELVETVRNDWRDLSHTDPTPHQQHQIADILPIHNVEGLSDISKVASMVDTIRADRHILDVGELPNIKLIVAPDGRLLLFDGHHSLLAYYQHGRRQLDEVPHVLVSGTNYGPVTPAELAPFYPAHEQEKILTNWGDYTVNWKLPLAEQLEQRKVFSFAELANASLVNY